MGSTQEVERSDTDVVVETTVSDSNGGVPGLTLTSALRDARTLDSYLDFADNTFKIAGWTTQRAAMAEIGGGRYARSGNLNLSAITNLPALTRKLIVEYDASGAVSGIDNDILILKDHLYDVAIATDILSDATPFAGANVDAAVSSRAAPADILSDATPFAGANVDAAVSSRAAPGAAMNLVAGAVDAAAIATDAIDADALATDAADEIATAVVAALPAEAQDFNTEGI